MKEHFLTKQQWRATLRTLNRALPAPEKEAAAQRIARRIEVDERFRSARCVACFCALPDEPPTEEWLARWSATKRIVVPRVEGEVMQFYDYRPEEMQAGSFGISEPDGSQTPCLPQEIDLMIVPGVAFAPDPTTGRGHIRLGRGKGFYDRYLASEGFRAPCIGVGFAHQSVAELPAEPHDRRIETVVTE